MLRSVFANVSQDFSSGQLAPNLCALSTALSCMPPPKGVVRASVPISRLYCAPRQLFVQHTFEKTPNTKAVVTSKPGLGGPPPCWVGSSLSSRPGPPPVSHEAQRPSGTARTVAFAKAHAQKPHGVSTQKNGTCVSRSLSYTLRVGLGGPQCR